MKHYTSAWACTRDVLRAEGIQGLFRGVTFPLITITFVRTLSFSVYTHTKELLARTWRKKKDKLSDATMSFEWFKGQANSCQPWALGGLNYKQSRTNRGFLMV